MSGLDDIKAKAEELAGKAKAKIGEATGNEQLEAEGRSEQAEGAAKGVVEDVKGVFGK